MSGETSAHDPSVNDEPTEPPYVPFAASSPPEPPPENLVRGLLLSLLAVPAGIIVFVLIWNLGFIASIVGFGVAVAAAFLYRLGSGGRVSIRGAFLIAGVTILTLVLAFVSAEFYTVAGEIARVNQVSVIQVLTTPELLGFIARTLTSPDVVGALVGDAAMTLLFGAIGCFTVLRGSFREARGASPTF